jgi:hypothetical protein
MQITLLRVRLDYSVSIASQRMYSGKPLTTGTAMISGKS